MTSLRQVRRGGAWTLLGEGSQRAAQSLTFVALATMLRPSEFGAAATAFFLVQVVYAATNAGLGAAVQALGRDDRRDGTARALALGLGAVAGLVLLVLAAPVAALMHAPEAVGLIRLTALVPPTLQYTTVVVALLERDFRFRTTALSQLVGSASSVAIGIGLALRGHGAVALVAAAVGQQLVRFLVVAAVSRTHVALAVDLRALRELWHVSRHLMSTSLMFALYSNLDTLAVGAVLGPRALGLYSFAYNAAMSTFQLAGVAVHRAMLPVLARMERDGGATGVTFGRSAVATSWLVSLPLGALAVLGPQLVHAFFGAQWDGAAWALRVLCAAAYLRMATAVCMPILVVRGRQKLLASVQAAQLGSLALLLYPAARIGGLVGCAVAVLLPVLGGSCLLLARSLHLAGLRARSVSLKVLAAPACSLGVAMIALAAGPAGGRAAGMTTLVADGLVFSGIALVAMRPAVFTWRAWPRPSVRSARIVVVAQRAEASVPSPVPIHTEPEVLA